MSQFFRKQKYLFAKNFTQTCLFAPTRIATPLSSHLSPECVQAEERVKGYQVFDWIETAVNWSNCLLFPSCCVISQKSANCAQEVAVMPAGQVPLFSSTEYHTARLVPCTSSDQHERNLYRVPHYLYSYSTTSSDNMRGISTEYHTIYTPSTTSSSQD